MVVWCGGGAAAASGGVVWSCGGVVMCGDVNGGDGVVWWRGGL